MSREELDLFYRFAAERFERGEAPESLEAAITYWRSRETLAAAAPFSDGKSLAQRLRASGVLGASESGPTDLSTNPIHMNGFGES